MTHRYSWDYIEKACSHIVFKMYQDFWKPDYVVGITPGGNVPAAIISSMIKCECESLKVSPESIINIDNTRCESNLWMSEDAFGYIDMEQQDIFKSRWDISRRKKILIVDSFAKTGDVFKYIKRDWQASCLPNQTDVWNTIWNNNVRFATITSYMPDIKIDYCSHYVNNKNFEVVYPWDFSQNNL